MNKLTLVGQEKIKKSLLKSIDLEYKNLASVSIEATLLENSYSQSVDHPPKTLITGSRLQRSSTKLSQGLYLAKIASFVTRQVGSSINILEIGTCAGISSMYLLAGMSESHGGHLVSFEGIPELADFAQKNINNFISKHNLQNVTHEIVVGNFESTIENFFSSQVNPLHIAFIDGNHHREPTLQYHELARGKLHELGIIIHDDISWSNEMSQTWIDIQQLEGKQNTSELYLGNKPSRGIVFLDRTNPVENEFVIEHIDGIVERYLRQTVKAIIQK